MAKKKTTREKLQKKKEVKKVRLDYDFAGLKQGSMMLVATPAIIEDYIQKIPFGETKQIPAMRREIARKRQCDGTCPVSTAIFVRLIAEAALEDLEDGKTVSEITPFWRLIDGKEKIAKRLSVDPAWINEQRALEADARVAQQ